MFAGLFVLALPLLATAAYPPAAVPASQCNTSDIQCCNGVQDASNPTAEFANLLSLVGVAAGSVTGQAGVQCSPLSVVGLNSNQCSAQPVCCTNNSFNGVVALGCSPINIGA